MEIMIDDDVTPRLPRAATRAGVFPFTALVGQERMKRALLLNAINPRLGGVLIRGEKGTAKSTAARALAALLPPLSVVAGCPFSCDPDQQEALCDGCAARRAAGEDLGRAERPARVVDLPVGATEDRVVGTLDLERAIGHGERRFEPGLLAQANRSILYVDEVNLLGDHLVDVLLDAAAMGRNVVEREGVAAAHPAVFVLVGTMNPEEGDLRPQLLDRFALAVEVAGMPNPDERAEVVRRRIAYEADPVAFGEEWAAVEQAARERINAARALLPRVRVDDVMLRLITSICAEAGVDGMRGDLVMYKTAATLAADGGRIVVTVDDVREAAELALPHRRRRQPFEQPGLDRAALDESIKRHQDREAGQGGSTEGAGSESNAEATDDEPGGGDSGVHGDERTPPTQGVDAATRVFAPEDGRQVPSLRLTRPDATVRAANGRRSITRAAGVGRYVHAAAPNGAARDLALDATLRAAAPYQRSRRALPAKGRAPRLLLRPSDVRVKVREARTGALVLFVVDASGSMGALQRMAAAKGMVLAFLRDAYRRRDRVGLITFRGTRAELALPPTSSVELAEQRLRELPTGGRTPLAHGLALAADTLRQNVRSNLSAIPLLIVLSDGRANVPLSGAGGDALTDSGAVAAMIARQGWASVVVDTEAGRTRLGLARALSDALGARYMRLDEMSDMAEMSAAHVSGVIGRRLS